MLYLSCPKCKEVDRKLTINIIDGYYRVSFECETCTYTISQQTGNLGLFLNILENEING